MFASTLWEYFSYCFTPFSLGVVFFPFFKAKGRGVGRFQRISNFCFFENAQKQILDGKGPCWNLTATYSPGIILTSETCHRQRRASTVGGGV